MMNYFYYSDYNSAKEICYNYARTWFLKVVVMGMIILLTVTIIQAQSGGWSNKLEWVPGGGYRDYGNGVIQLLDNVNNGCEATAVYQTTTKYNPCTDGNFSKCYQVLFGCNDIPGADGLAFTFATCSSVPSTYQVWGCGGGLGYVDACNNNKGITIEFDTFDNGGVNDFDTGFEGGPSIDQIAIHKNMQAKTAPGKVIGAAVPNLEDGQEHKVCINYNKTTHVLSASIDGITRISYDLGLAGLEFQSYFFAGGCGGLDQFWSAGTNGGTNMEVVSNGANIYNNAGALCPGMLPVEFLKLNAQSNTSSVIVSWSTATEKSNAKFIIERSDNASDWVAIGEVSGAGNSTSVINYNFTDEGPMRGASYYRIRQVDTNGAYDYSNAVAVKRDVHHVNISPNPFEKGLTIRSQINGNMDITIRDVLGRMVYHTNQKSENDMITIQPELEAGAYIITIQTETFIEQQKIISK